MWFKKKGSRNCNARERDLKRNWSRVMLVIKIFIHFLFLLKKNVNFHYTCMVASTQNLPPMYSKKACALKTNSVCCLLESVYSSTLYPWFYIKTSFCICKDHVVEPQIVLDNQGFSMYLLWIWFQWKCFCPLVESKTSTFFRNVYHFRIRTPP